MKGVRQITTQNRALTEIDQLADAVGPTEHTDVCVYSHDHDISDSVRRQQVPHLLPIVCHGVTERDLD